MCFLEVFLYDFEAHSSLINAPKIRFEPKHTSYYLRSFELMSQVSCSNSQDGDCFSQSRIESKVLINGKFFNIKRATSLMQPFFISLRWFLLIETCSIVFDVNYFFHCIDRFITYTLNHCIV